MGRVFLSYARDDLRRASKVAEALEVAGHDVWWDSRLKGGAEYSEKIDEALTSADSVVVLWSKTSVHSEWVRDEAAVGKQNGRLVPATIDGTQPPLGFRQLHTIDLSGRGRTGLQRLIEAVGEGAGQVRLNPAKSMPRSAWTRWWIGGGIALLLLIAAGLYLTRESPSAERQVSLAVLPFADLSPAKDKAYFAEGLAEEILSTLAAEPGIKVLGRTSARMIERGADPVRLRKQLAVTHLLEGSARSAGDQLRINVRLIDTEDGRQVWEEEYQGRPADVFAVQDQIAEAVVQRLRGMLPGRKVRSASETSVETYQNYLAARALMRSRSLTSLREAFNLAQRVVRSDPKYPPGRALLAELYFLLSDAVTAYGSMPIEEARKLGGSHARAAIRLNPNVADGYAALGLLLPAEQALAPMQRALELDPSRADLRSWYGSLLHELGRHDEGLVHTRAAVSIDPLAFAPVTRLVQTLATSGLHEEANQTVEQFRARGGDADLVHPFMMLIAQGQGDWSGAILHGRRAIARGAMRHDYFLRGMAADLFALGFASEAASILPSGLGQFHAPFYAGDFARLRQNINRHGPSIWAMKDGGFAFTYLASSRDWKALVDLYDRGPPQGRSCLAMPDYLPISFVLALRGVGRQGEADALLGCVRQRLALETRQKARFPPAFPADLEFNRASLSALEGDSAGALHWLGRAVDRRWAGQPYSSRLSHYPQFDALKGDPRLALLQQRIDAAIAKERREYLAQR